MKPLLYRRGIKCIKEEKLRIQAQNMKDYHFYATN